MRKFVSGFNINLRDINIEDAQFVVDLRLASKNKFLAKDVTLETQMNYINKYKEQDSSWFFIIESKTNEKLGSVRIYDIKEDSFSWGSWLIKEGAPHTTAMESAMLLYDFAFNSLGFSQSHFDVRKENKKVISFHKKLGATMVDENDLDVFFIMKKEDFEIHRNKYEGILHCG